MKYFITGGSGLIGSWLIRQLIEQGHEVVNFDIEIKNEVPNSRYHWVVGDVLQKWALESYMKENVDVVIHLAAQSGVEAVRKQGYDSFYLNIVGTLNVLEACVQAGVQNVVVASSNHVYGKQYQDLNFTREDWHPLNHLDAYSAGKICADYLTRAYAHNYGLNAVAVRVTNTYGPNDPHSDHIIPSTILSLLDGLSPVLWTDGQTKKSYLYGQDCADAFITIAENCEKLKGQAVNVVGCEPISALDLSLKLCAMLGGELKPIVESKPSDQHSEFLDGSKMKALGWEPKFSLEQGLQETVEFFKSRAGVSA